MKSFNRQYTVEQRMRILKRLLEMQRAREIGPIDCVDDMTRLTICEDPYPVAPYYSRRVGWPEAEAIAFPETAKQVPERQAVKKLLAFKRRAAG